MTKVEFIIELNSLLNDLNKEEREEAISFYVELIEEKMEKGVNEVDAVASLGDIKDIASQILEDKKAPIDETNEEVKDETEASFEYVTNKGTNVFNKLVNDFENLSLGMKVISIITLVISLPIIVGYLTSIVPLVILVLMIYLVWSIKNEKHSAETLKNMRTFLKVLFIVGIIVAIPLLIALYVAPLGIFVGTSLFFLITGMIGMFNLAFVGTAEVVFTVGTLMVGISALILSIMLLVKIYKVLNHCLSVIYEDIKKEVA